MSKKVNNLKGVAGDDIFCIVNTEDTNFCIIKFDALGNNGLKCKDQVPDLVEARGWRYKTKEDKNFAETLYNTEISDKFIWKEN